MTIEEKAKAYDEALKLARKSWLENQEPGFKRYREFLESMFCELRESDDERTRKDLMVEVQSWEGIPEFKRRNYLAYLEKQKEQKPADVDYISGIREELLDIENNAKNIDGLTESQWVAIRAAHRLLGEYIEQGQKSVPKFKVGDLVKDVNHHGCPVYKIIGTDDECYICKSDDATLGDRAVMHFTFDNPYLRLVNPKPAERSEEDTEMYINVASSLRGYACGLENEDHKRHIQKELDWFENRFKSLRPSWKPSEDEMAALKEASASWMNEKMGNAELLKSLYDGLNKNVL